MSVSRIILEKRKAKFKETDIKILVPRVQKKL